MSRKFAGFDAAVLLAGVGDDVERGHDQAGAVADDADLAVELDVVEVLLLGLRLQRVGRARVSNAAWSACRKSAFSSSVTLPSSATSLPSPVRTSGLTSTSVASSSTKTSHSFSSTSTTWSSTSAGKRGLGRRSRAAFASSTPAPRVDRRSARAPRGCSTASSSISMPPSTLAITRYGAVGAVEQEGEVVLLRDVAACASSTRWTVWPLMSMPRIASAVLDAPRRASSASLTPPALPRPPVLTWALTTTTPPSSRLRPPASSAVVDDDAERTGTPCLAKSSFAWYSNRSTVRPFHRCHVRHRAAGRPASA